MDVATYQFAAQYTCNGSAVVEHPIANRKVAGSIPAHVAPQSTRPGDSVFGICGRFPSRNSHRYGQVPLNEPL